MVKLVLVGVSASVGRQEAPPLLSSTSGRAAAAAGALDDVQSGTGRRTTTTTSSVATAKIALPMRAVLETAGRTTVFHHRTPAPLSPSHLIVFQRFILKTLKNAEHLHISSLGLDSFYCMDQICGQTVSETSFRRRIRGASRTKLTFFSRNLLYCFKAPPY